MSPWNKGLKGVQIHSKETRKKMSESLKGNKNSLGKKASTETKLKMSLAKTGKKYRLGKLSSEETKKKQSDSITRFYDLKGRKEYKRYIHLTSSKEYKQWRSDVFTRDNWTCQTCGVRGCYIEAHHIKSWAKFPELRYEVSNGVALCLPCHKLTDNYKNKKNE